MKRLAAFVVCLVLLSGCSADTAIEKPMTLRNRLMNSNGFSFVATIIADYGEKYYEFEMDCQVQTSGELSFSVSKPESISGISGTVTEKGASLKFDDKVLAFEMLADDQITPVIAPWLTVRALLSGYIHAVGRDGALYQVKIHDSFRGETLETDLWLDENGLPLQAQFLWKGKKILSVNVRNFVIL